MLEATSVPRRSRTPDIAKVSGIVSAREAAALLGCGERTIRRAIHRGELPATKHGRAFRISREAIECYRARCGNARGNRPSGTITTLFPERGAPADAEELRRAREPRPAQLVPLTSFIGRERETAAVAALLRRDDVRLVTLTGPGGVGKTRLALRVSDAIADAFADGVAVVPLAAVRRAELVAPTILQTLGVRERKDRPPAVQLSAFLHGRELLLVLDNFEQVTDAAPVLTDLLRAAPRLTILVTSRTPIHVSGERLFAVPPLELPQRRTIAGGQSPLPPLAESAAAEAVQLFAARARDVATGFSLTEENIHAVAAICERADGMPLAIELAAARAHVLSPAELLARLSRRLHLLRDGPHDQPPRLRSMRDAIAWSHDLLTPEEQTLFRRLAVFVGGFTIEGVEWVEGERRASEVGSRTSGGAAPASAVLPTPDARHPTPDSLDLLIALVDKSLVRRGPDAGGQTRYAMLETVREFGLERLAASGEEPAARDAHADWCTALARRADPELSGPAQATWFARLEAEHPNFRAALTWLREQGDAERGLILASALTWFWSSRGYLREAAAWFEQFLEQPTTADTRGHGLLEASNIVHWQGDFERAVAYAEEALPIFRAAGDHRSAAYALRRLASVAIDRADHERAADLLDQIEEILATAGNRWDAAFARYLAGRLALARDRDEEAMREFAAAAEAFRTVGDRGYVAAALAYRGMAAVSRGDLGAARTAYAASLALAHELNELTSFAWSLTGAASLAHADGQPATAARLLGAAAALREAIGEADWPEADPVAVVRSALGDDRFAKGWQQGRNLSREQVIAEAQAVLATSGRRSRSRARLVPGAPPPLTPRERDVLRLLIAGLSDKEIAAVLGIARYTASNHVTAIREKLGASSRAAAAALAVRDRLV